MDTSTTFQGFSKETVSFFKKLKKYNTREWFEGNRDIYEKHVLEPAKAFVSAMGPGLKRISPHIVVAPKVNKSIFRLNRDTRFSKDKSPYKPNLGIYFWEGPLSRMESPGFYVHLEPPTFMIAGGYYLFPEWLIMPFRKAVVHPKYGKELTAILSKITALKDFEVGGQHYKRVPAGFDASHPNASLLLHNGVHAGLETGIPKQFFSAKLVDFCLDKIEPLVPLHRWCAALLRRSRPPSPQIHG